MRITNFAHMSKKSEKKPAPVRGQKTGPAKGAPARPGFLKRNRLQVILFCVVFIVFGNSIFNQYALDDEFYTAGSNQLTQQGVKGIPEIFKSRTFQNNDGSGYSYRPVAVTSFALEIQLFGEHARVSHFINVLLYGFIIVLLYGVLRKWFKAQGDWFPFFICLLFLVHPVHTEVVANIKCRDELLAFFFSICTLHFVWKHIETGKAWTWVAIAASFAMAIMSKTSIAPFFLLIPFAVWYFTEKKWWQAAIYILPLLAAVLFVRLALIANIPEMSRTLQGFENPIRDMSFGQLSATAFYVLGRYLLLMILPYRLIFYYGLNEVPVCSWSDPMVIISFVLYLALAVWTWFEFRKRTATGFGLVFFLANIALFSNFFGAAPGLMAERFAFSASLGFVIAAVDLLFRWKKTLPQTFVWKAEASKNLRYILLGIVVVFGIRSIVRNEAWQDKETLYRNDVAIAPESAKINMLLGSLLSAQAAEKNFMAQQKFSYAQQLAAQGQQQYAAQQKDSATLMRDDAYALFVEARAYYQKATEIFPTYYTAWSNLGTSYYFTKEYAGGIPHFKKALSIKKDYAEAYFNLGMSYEQMALTKGKVTDSAFLDSSFYYFEEGLRQDPHYVNSADQLSRMYYQYRNDSVGAIRLLQKVAADNPKSAAPWNAMSRVYLQAKDTVGAVAALEKAAQLDPNNISRLQNLVAYFQRHNNPEKASYYNNLLLQKQAEQKKKQRLIGKGK